MAEPTWRAFHAVAKDLALARAAQALSMTQPTVSVGIRRLEEHRATRWSDRARGSISLTRAGKPAFRCAGREARYGPIRDQP